MTLQVMKNGYGLRRCLKNRDYSNNVIFDSKAQNKKKLLTLSPSVRYNKHEFVEILGEASTGLAESAFCYTKSWTHIQKIKHASC